MEFPPLTDLLLTLFLSCIVPGGSATAPSAPSTQPVPAIRAETDQVSEASGIVASQINRDIYWTHNDSGPYRPRVWAFRLARDDRNRRIARHMGYVELINAGTRDWEDIAIGPNQMLYIFDGGDNPPCNRSDKRIYRFAEPTIDPQGTPVALTVSAQSIRFEYPSPTQPAVPAITDAHRYDAECLFVHPATGDIYIVTKRDNDDGRVARVYKLSAKTIRWNSARVHVLEFVADLTNRFLIAVTAGDIDPKSRNVLIRDYIGAYEFRPRPGAPFETMFEQKPAPIRLMPEFQGEGVCYSADGAAIVTTSEVKRFNMSQFLIHYLPRIDVPTTAAKPTPASGPAVGR